MLTRLALIRANIAAGVFSDALVAGLNAGMAIMKRRIFNQSMDANGQSLGPYFSESYERERRRNGRQISKKDLENTGSVRRAIEVVTVNNTKAEIRIVNLEAADIARWQEQQIANLRAGRSGNDNSGLKVPIFELNEVEIDIVRTTTRDLIRQKFEFL